MSEKIPDNRDALLTRDAVAAALTAAGYPMKPKTLGTIASRASAALDSGPPFRKWGKNVLYRWGDALDWAESRLR
jgi:hypothetical protein